MWVLPKNYQLSSAFAADMVESKEDLTLQGLNIESSLMWRSKPSPLRTWSTRWKEGSYLPHLFTRILKPSHRTCFEEKLASSLAVIHASHLVQQESGSEKMTPDTCGHISGDTSNQLNLFNASLKTSKDTYRLDSPQLSATWKKMVISQRGEYLARVKLAHPTKESESISWQTPTASDWKNMDTANQPMLSKQVRNWPTATVFDVTGGSYPTEEKMWPTPAARDYKGANGYESTVQKIADGKRAQMGQLPNAVMIENGGPGQLNPAWVEWLMGVPTGWTELDF